MRQSRFNNNRDIDLNGNGILGEPTDGFSPQVNYGVEQGKSFKNELGLITLETDFNKEIVKNLILQLHYWSFTTYKNPAATDVRGEVALIAKVNTFMNVKLSSIVLYDQDQDLTIQYAQVFMLNVSMNSGK